ncbi:hypothetical protein QTQ03_25175 [Micromonospora sp. WMMA1363]|uniref:hypothetical protein n=1 Tax=Micromonospora sp. WMMA1363 TaxID=3053985 RepID=UPI00259C82C1|nr:hypothetical protein [Micromonospora sp. WMMA1363]MDM4722727.1 hypothetical protein [Micromonospora sp. WMMA1363]
MTSMCDEPSATEVARLAAVIVSWHRDGGRCGECRPDGCCEMAWAVPEWEAWQQERAATRNG